MICEAPKLAPLVKVYGVEAQRNWGVALPRREEEDRAAKNRDHCCADYQSATLYGVR